MNEIKLVNTESYLNKITQTKKGFLNSETEASLDRLGRSKKEVEIKENGNIDLDTNLYDLRIKYSEVKEGDVPNKEPILLDQEYADFLKYQREINSFVIKTKKGDHEVDLMNILPDDYRVFFSQNSSFAQGEIFWEQKKICLNGDMTTPAMVVVLLHEIGHAWDFARLKKFGLSRLTDEHVYSDKAEEIHRERVANAYALKVLRPYINGQTRNDVLNLLKHYALKSYNDRVSDELATHEAMSHYGQDFVEYTEEEMKRDDLLLDFQNWKKTSEYVKWKNLKKFQNLDDYEEFDFWCEWKEEQEEINIQKDKLDLKPNLDFVSQNKDLFEKGLSDILARLVEKEAWKWVNEVEFIGTQDIVEPQVLPEDIRKILSRMPEVLIKLSKLKKISYHTFGRAKVIPVPGFNEDGTFNSTKVQLVPVDEFPREEDHPSRILVGVSTGETIYPTPIPKSVSEDERAVFLYQVHVLIHEFFHTIDYPRRTKEAREAVLFESEGEKFTFQDWWKDWEVLFLKEKEPGCVSSYANTYENDLNQTVFEKDYAKFTAALAEQICESFVAYQLGIIANNDGWTDFKKESLGNKEQADRFQLGQAPSANLKWLLLDKLCRAKLVVKK